MINGDRTFVDTNVLAYAFDASEARKRPLAEALLDELWGRRTGCISTQVLQELYVVVTRKLIPPMDPVIARQIVALYGNWPVVEVDVALILAASELEQHHQLSFWDALIIEAARRAGATRLVTEDLQSATRIGGLRIENPFI